MSNLKTYFEHGNEPTSIHAHINACINESISDIADTLTQNECNDKGLECFIETDGGVSYTDEAQDLYNAYDDMISGDIWKLVNMVLSELSPEAFKFSHIEAFSNKGDNEEDLTDEVNLMLDYLKGTEYWEDRDSFPTTKKALKRISKWAKQFDARYKDMDWEAVLFDDQDLWAISVKRHGQKLMNWEEACEDYIQFKLEEKYGH